MGTLGVGSATLAAAQQRAGDTPTETSTEEEAVGVALQKRKEDTAEPHSESPEIRNMKRSYLAVLVNPAGGIGRAAAAPSVGQGALAEETHQCWATSR